MRKSDLAKLADPTNFASAVTANRPKRRKGHAHAKPITTERRDSYGGHEIVIRTTYEISIDSEAVGGHVGVGNDGRVHYHPLPNYSFTSAVEMARQLIDSFPEDFPEAPAAGAQDYRLHVHEHRDEHD